MRMPGIIGLLSSKIKYKILATSIVLLVVTTVFCVGFSYNKTRDLLFEVKQSELKQHSAKVFEQLHPWLTDVIDSAKQTAANPIVKQALVEESMTEMASSAFNGEVMISDFYKSLHLVDNSGIIVASSLPLQDLKNRDLSQTQYFKTVQQTKKTMLANKYSLSEDKQSVLFNVLIPITKDDVFLGVLVTSIDLCAFTKSHIDTVKVGELGYVYVISGEGLVIAHPNKSYLSQLNLMTNEKTRSFGEEILSNKEGIIINNWDGAQQLTIYGTFEETGWIVAVAADTSEMLSPLFRIAVTNFSVALIIVLIACFVIWKVADKITVPMIESFQFIEDLSRGKLDKRLEIKTSDEVALMGNALNNFIDILENKAKDLEIISTGNLSINTQIATEDDTLGKSLLQMTRNLNGVIHQVFEAARQIDSGSGEVSSASQAIATGANEQVGALQEISSTMNQISSMAKINREYASNAKEFSAQTLADVNRSNTQMETMLTSMNNINKTSSDVSKVIKAIDEIAFQTNLLALNAAVEAARAGKYGKGFAVVAEEVRNLAARSAKAAKSTTELIQSSIGEVTKGVEIADQTAEILKGFVASIEKVAEIVNEITEASEKQEKGAEEINDSIKKMDKIVQQNSAISEETASASAELSDQAGFLIELMQKFKLNLS